MHSESQEVEALPDKPRRRILSPEERLAKLDAETKRVKELQRTRVRDCIDDALDVLRDAQAKATAAGMETESRMIGAAIAALETKPEA